MKQKFYYKEDENFPIYSIAVVGDFNDWNPKETLLERNGFGEWQAEIELGQGEYSYQFLINGNIYMNDCMANLYLTNEEGRLVSCIKLNEEGKRLYNVTQYKLNIKRCYFTEINEAREVAIQKLWFKKLDAQVRMNIVFNQVTGIHSVTTIWCHQDEKTYTYTDQILYLENEEEETELGFTLGGDIAVGAWIVKVFIDGKFIMNCPLLVVEDEQLARIERLLPIGSVVRLEKGNKNLMITGRIQRPLAGGKLYDYSGCYYPEGIIKSNHNILFNHEQIEKVIFTGLINDEENTYKEQLIGYFKRKLETEK